MHTILTCASLFHWEFGNRRPNKSASTPFFRPRFYFKFCHNIEEFGTHNFYSIFGFPRLNLHSWIKNISMLDLKPQRFLPSDKVVIKARHIDWEEVYLHVLRFDIACTLAILSLVISIWALCVLLFQVCGVVSSATFLFVLPLNFVEAKGLSLGEQGLFRHFPWSGTAVPSCSDRRLPSTCMPSRSSPMSDSFSSESSLWSCATVVKIRVLWIAFANPKG